MSDPHTLEGRSWQMYTIYLSLWCVWRGGAGGVFFESHFWLLSTKTDFCGREKLPGILGTSGIPDAEGVTSSNFNKSLLTSIESCGRDTETESLSLASGITTGGKTGRELSLWLQTCQYWVRLDRKALLMSVSVKCGAPSPGSSAQNSAKVHHGRVLPG